MFDFWLGGCELIQILAQGPAKAPANGGDAGVLGPLISSPILPFLAIGIVFYFLMMRPEQRKRKEQEKLLSALKKNDHVVTIGGICGTIVNASPGSTYVTIRVDDSNNTRLRILRSAISRVGSPDEAAEDVKEGK